MALTTELIKRFPGLSRKGAPTYSPETLGNVERMNQTGQNQLNTLLPDLRLRYSLAEHEFTIDHPAFKWLVQHNAFLLGRYLLHTDGQTAYERRWGKTYGSAPCQFGETVMCKLSQPSSANTNPPWHTAIWLGRDSAANDIIVALGNGTARKVGTIKRLPPDQQCNRELLLSVSGLPENPRGLGRLDKEFIVQLRYLQDLQVQHETGQTREQRTEDYRQKTEMKRPVQRPATVAVNPTADDAENQTPGLREDDEDKGPDPITAQDLVDDIEADEDELAPDHPKGATGSVKRTVDDTTDGLGNSRPKKLRIHTLNHTLNHVETKRGLKTVEVTEDPEEKELIEKLKKN